MTGYCDGCGNTACICPVGAGVATLPPIAGVFERAMSETIAAFFRQREKGIREHGIEWTPDVDFGRYCLEEQVDQIVYRTALVMQNEALTVGVKRLTAESDLLAAEVHALTLHTQRLTQELSDTKRLLGVVRTDRRMQRPLIEKLGAEAQDQKARADRELNLRLANEHMAGLGRVFAEIQEWGSETFTESTAASTAKHLLKEAQELVAAPSDRMEMADIFFLLAQLCRVTGTDLAEAAAEKLVQNRARAWGKPDADGIVEHVRENEHDESILPVGHPDHRCMYCGCASAAAHLERC